MRLLFKRFMNWLRAKAPPQFGLGKPEDDAALVAAAGGSGHHGHRPKILISGGDADSKSVAAIVTQIRSAGGDPVVVVDHAERLQKRGGDMSKIVTEDLAGVDTLIVMGNNSDIDPAKYGQTKHNKTNIETDAARTSYEEAALQMAMDIGMPTLGVCGGMQRINVLKHEEHGGTLNQHVPDVVGNNHHAQQDSKIAPFVPVQFIMFAEGTKLGKIAGTVPGIYSPQHGQLPPGIVMENSMHHQAVDKVRDDFRVAAVSDDGVIEAIESKDGKTLGVQWHPEFGASELGAKLAKHMVGQAKAYERTHPHEAVAKPAQSDVPGSMAARILAERQNAVLYR
jgi:putative glutamine amidotransferase